MTSSDATPPSFPPMKLALPHLPLLLMLVLAAAAPAPGGPRVEWDPATLVLVAPGGHYGRMLRLRGGAILAGYSAGGACLARRSDDGGKTWAEPVQVAAFAGGSATNAELLELDGGRVMFLWNERDPKDKHRNGIALATSADGGRTWAGRRRVFTGACWEPAAIRRGRRVDLYFANEQPFPDTSEQEISVMRSADGGATWGEPAAVSFRRGHRDGMPVPLALPRGRTVLAVEDDGLAGRFKPAIVDVTSRRNLPVGGDDPRRRGALADPLPAGVYAGAPYLCRLPGGPCVLSYQRAEPGTDRPLTMVVEVGTPDARDFENPSHPFSMADAGKSQAWNAVFAKGPGTVTAISGTTIGGRSGLWAIDGRVVRKPGGG